MPTPSNMTDISIHPVSLLKNPSQLVNDLLEEHMVIPINSPYYTPKYNGAIEHCQGEFKTWLIQWKHAAGTKRELALQVGNAAHVLNHHTRRSLSGKNACGGGSRAGP